MWIEKVRKYDKTHSNVMIPISLENKTGEDLLKDFLKWLEKSDISNKWSAYYLFVEEKMGIKKSLMGPSGG